MPKEYSSRSTRWQVSITKIHLQQIIIQERHRRLRANNKKHKPIGTFSDKSIPPKVGPNIPPNLPTPFASPTPVDPTFAGKILRNKGI
jgi:hypothetical protein